MKSLFKTRSLSALLIIGLASAASMAACGGDDGQDGDPLLIDEAPASDECGDLDGTVVTIGYDTDGDGAVDDVVDTYHICDGEDGPDGEPGEPGEDGRDAPVVVTSVESTSPGGECAYGGQRVAFGLDRNHDGSFEEDDLLSAEYICNNTCTGEMDLEVDIGTLPSVLYEGFENRVSVETDAEDLAFFAYSTEHFLSTGDSAARLDIEYDSDAEELILTPDADGSDDANFIVLITDGCDTTVKNLDFSDFAEGEATVYFAHLADGAGPVSARLQGDDDALGTLDFTDVAGPLTFDTNESYTFELLDDDDDVIFTTDELEFMEPWTTKTIFAYFDDGDLVVDVREAATDNIPLEKSRFQVQHLAENDLEDADLIRVDEDGDLTYEWADLAFPELTPVIEFDADPGTYFAFDDVGDGDPHVDFNSMAGLFLGGNAVDGYVIETDAGTEMLTIDFSTGIAEIHNPNVQTYFQSVDADLSDEEDYTNSVTVTGCDTVVDIDLDIVFFNTWRGDFTVYLEDPSGDEIPLKSRFGGSTNDIIGNFNETLDPETGFNGVDGVEPISYFEGADGNGEWTIRIFDHDPPWNSNPFFESWQLNLVCGS